jgi:hypothetical protein
MESSVLISLEPDPTERGRLQQMGLELTERVWQGQYASLRARSLFLTTPGREYD